jgi:hypothetical protein
MGLAVLRGQFPLYFFGQPFMGALGDAYLVAPLFALFGVSAWTLEALPVLLSLLWLGLMLRLAIDAFGRRAGLFSLAVLALPADSLLRWMHEARPHYVLLLPLGTLALLLALRASRFPPRRAALSFGVLGLVLGMAFWTNFLSVVYVPAVAMLILSLSPSRRHLRSALAVGPGFVLGSLPHWLYGLGHGTAVPEAGGWIGFSALGAHLLGFVQGAWPSLAGVPGAWHGTPVGLALAAGLGTVYGLALVGAIRGYPAETPASRAAGRALAVLVGVNLAIAAGTQYGHTLDDNARYLLPLYVALPLLLGRWLARLPGWRFPALLAGAVAIVHAVGALSGELGILVPRVAAAERAQVAETFDAVASLDRRGVSRLYGPHWQRRLTFFSRERIILSAPYAEANPFYAVAVDGAERAAWGIVNQNPIFERHLQALGVGFTFESVAPWGGVYRDFALRGAAVRELDPDGWRVTTSHQSELATHLHDRDGSTLWDPGRLQHGDEWVQVDLGRIERVALVRWLPSTYRDVPAGVALEGSLDGEAWARLLDLTPSWGLLYWSAGRPMARVRSGRMELRIRPTPLRHLRIVQTGRSDRVTWGIRELFVYGAIGGLGETPPVTGARLAEALRSARVSRLYADHGWGSRVALADPAVRILPANLSIDSSRFVGDQEDLLPPVHWGPGSGILVEPAEADGVARALREHRRGFTMREVGELRLFVHAPPPPRPAGQRVPATELTATGFPRPEGAALALDGNRQTVWTTGKPRDAEDWFRIDLRTPRAIRALRLWPGNPAAWPRGLVLEGSLDGVTWRGLSVEATTEGRQRWGGIALLRDGVDAVRLDFEPTVLSALRLRSSRGDQVAEWAIAELAVLARE